MNAAEAEIIRISREYAEACADCEEHRRTECYPYMRWNEAWARRSRLLSAWIQAAQRLTHRPTEPPDDTADDGRRVA